MGRAVTGGLHGKDLTKADVSVNIYVHLAVNAEHNNFNVNDKYNNFDDTCTGICAIGDSTLKFDNIIGEVPFENIVKVASAYIKKIGGFEKLAEWGLIR